MAGAKVPFHSFKEGIIAIGDDKSCGVHGCFLPYPLMFIRG
jgi:hypothetical protein